MNNFKGFKMKKSKGKIKHFKQSYSELSKVGQKYYNDNNFCTVIGLAVGCDLSFGKARAIAEKIAKRKKGRGLQIGGIRAMFRAMGKDLFLVNNLYGATLGTVSRNAPKDGRYLFLTRSHCAVSRDGILEDWSAKGSRHRVIECYKIVTI